MQNQTRSRWEAGQSGAVCLAVRAEKGSSPLFLLLQGITRARSRAYAARSAPSPGFKGRAGEVPSWNSVPGWSLGSVPRGTHPPQVLPCGSARVSGLDMRAEQEFRLSVKVDVGSLGG